MLFIIYELMAKTSGTDGYNSWLAQTIGKTAILVSHVCLLLPLKFVQIIFAQNSKGLPKMWSFWIRFPTKWLSALKYCPIKLQLRKCCSLDTFGNSIRSPEVSGFYWFFFLIETWSKCIGKATVAQRGAIKYLSTNHSTRQSDWTPQGNTIHQTLQSEP